MKTKSIIQSDALAVVSPIKRCSAALSVGVGKTLLGLTHMNQIRDDFSKFLVVAPKRSIFQSWKDEAVKMNLGHLISHIRFSTYLSLSKQDLDYDYVYLDEVHNLKFSHKQWLTKYTGGILGLTGTKPNSKFSEHYKMIEEFCPIVYEYVTDDAISDSILNDYRIIVHFAELDSRKNIKVEKKGQIWYASEESTYNYWTSRLVGAMGKEAQICRIMRMKCLMDFKSKETLINNLHTKYADDAIKTIFFANTKAQADRLCHHSYHTGNKYSEQNLEAFKKGHIFSMSCVLQLSEGINIPGLRQLFILHSYGKGSAKLKQRIGRGLRLNPDETCTVHLFCYRNTVDEQWVRESLQDFDQSKITYK